MPIVNKVLVHFSPRQAFFARCPSCYHFINWRHDVKQEGKLQATCCGFIFDALSTEWPMSIEIRVSDASAANVIEFPRRSMAPAPMPAA